MILSNFFLILLINYISLLNSKVVIPFQIKNYKHEKGDKEFILNYFYKDLIVNILVGTPPQQISLAACLGEYNTFILGKNCKGYDKGKYNESNSQTYLSIENSQMFVFEVYSNGNFSKDVFKFGNNVIDDYHFINAIEMNGDYNCWESYCEIITEPGILGLLMQPHRNAEYNFTEYNFINQLKRKDLISRYEFYFDFYSNDSGNIIIGSLPNETDNEFYKDKTFSTIKVSLGEFTLDYAFSFDNVYYGEEKIEDDVKKDYIIRAEFGFIKGSQEMKKVFDNNFFNYVNKSCFRKNTNEFGSSFYYYYCNKDANLDIFKDWKFTINNFETNFTLTKDDLFLDIGDKYIFLMGFGYGSKLILGYPFLKKYKIIFNQDSKTLGYFHKSNELEPEENKFHVGYIIIIAILFIILIGLGVIGFAYFSKYKKKKKMAKELSEENDTKNNNEGLIPNENN